MHTGLRACHTVSLIAYLCMEAGTHAMYTLTHNRASRFLTFTQHYTSVDAWYWLFGSLCLTSCPHEHVCGNGLSSIWTVVGLRRGA